MTPIAPSKSFIPLTTLEPVLPKDNPTLVVRVGFVSIELQPGFAPQLLIQIAYEQDPPHVQQYLIQCFVDDLNGIGRCPSHVSCNLLLNVKLSRQCIKCLVRNL